MITLVKEEKLRKELVIVQALDAAAWEGDECQTEREGGGGCDEERVWLPLSSSRYFSICYWELVSKCDHMLKCFTY